MNSLPKFILAALVGFALAFVLLGGGGERKAGTGAYTALPQWFGGGVTIGIQGTAVAQSIDTTCTARSYGTLAATSSARLDCPVTGVLPTDRVAVQLPLAANAAALNFVIGGAGASTTADYVSFWIFNLTGTATSSYPQATTSVHVMVTR